MNPRGKEENEDGRGSKEFAKGIPFAEMMGKMMAAKKSPGSFNCAEMMSQMMEMCCGTGRKEEGARPRCQKE
jgi:hypothetical protein